MSAQQQLDLVWALADESGNAVRRARKSNGAAVPPVEKHTRQSGDANVSPAAFEKISPATPPSRGRNGGRIVIGGTLAVTGLILAAGGMLMTVNYSVTAAAGLDRLLLAGLAATADVLALIAPSAAICLWHARRRSLSLAAAVLWLIAASITLQNLGGFLGSYGDGFTANRQTLSTERALVLERVNRLRSERAAISERRPIAVIVVAIRNATVAKIDDERAALAIAKRRDDLDAQLAALEATIPSLPAISAADPSAATIAGVISLITGGQVVIADDLFRRLRLLALIALPLFAGPILGLGTATLAGERKR
jgi:hypothetical protein